MINMADRFLYHWVAQLPGEYGSTIEWWEAFHAKMREVDRHNADIRRRQEALIQSLKRHIRAFADLDWERNRAFRANAADDVSECDDCGGACSDATSTDASDADRLCPACSSKRATDGEHCVRCLGAFGEETPILARDGEICGACALRPPEPLPTWSVVEEVRRWAGHEHVLAVQTAQNGDAE